MTKKIIFLSVSLFSALFSSIVFAMPSPQAIPLDNVAQFGSYVEKNTSEIIETSVSLAKEAMGTKPATTDCFFLVTRAINISPYGQDIDQGKKAFATLDMACGTLDCTRDVFVSVKSNEWGESRVLTFRLAPTTSCKSTAQ